MLFTKKIPPRCEYCHRGTALGENKVMCIKKGVMSRDHHCGRFRYDPLKRIPPRTFVPDFSRLHDSDFSL